MRLWFLIDIDSSCGLKNWPKSSITDYPIPPLCVRNFDRVLKTLLAVGPLKECRQPWRTSLQHTPFSTISEAHWPNVIKCQLVGVLTCIIFRLLSILHTNDALSNHDTYRTL